MSKTFIQIKQSALQKMLYFITHQGIANYTTVKYKYTPTRMAKIEKTENPKYGEDVEKLKLSYIMNKKANNHFGEKNLAVSHNLNLHVPDG